MAGHLRGVVASPDVPTSRTCRTGSPTATAYAVLAVLACRALSGGRALDLRARRGRARACVAYGVTDELHQSFVPGRHADVWDVAKDARAAGRAALYGPARCCAPDASVRTAAMSARCASRWCRATASARGHRAGGKRPGGGRRGRGPTWRSRASTGAPTTTWRPGSACRRARSRCCSRSSTPILLGAMGDPRVPDNRHAADILLGLRFQLDLYVNYRPVRCSTRGSARSRARAARTSTSSCSGRTPKAST